MENNRHLQAQLTYYQTQILRAIKCTDTDIASNKNQAQIIFILIFYSILITKQFHYYQIIINPMSSSSLQQDMYEVEKILKKRKSNGRVQYKIKWMGWDRPQDQTWQPLDNLQTVPHLLRDFEDKQKLKKIDLTKRIHKEKNILKNKQFRDHQKFNESEEEVSQYSVVDLEQIRKQRSSTRNQISSKNTLNLNNINSQLRINLTASDPPKTIKKKLNLYSQQSPKKKKSSNSQKRPQFISRNSSQTFKQPTKQIQKQRKQFVNAMPNYYYFEGKDPQKDIISKPYQVGDINYFIVENKNKLFYDVDIINTNTKKCVGVQKLTSEYLKKHAKQKLSDFLEQYLIQYDHVESITLKNSSYNPISNQNNRSQALW